MRRILTVCVAVVATVKRFYGISDWPLPAQFCRMSDVRQVPSRANVLSRRDSAGNNKLGLENLNDVAAFVYRTT